MNYLTFTSHVESLIFNYLVVLLFYFILRYFIRYPQVLAYVIKIRSHWSRFAVPISQPLTRHWSHCVMRIQIDYYYYYYCIERLLTK